MKITVQRHSLIVWMLYASILFSLLGCGIHHGQMAGLALSGLSGGFCAHNSDGNGAFDAGDADYDLHAFSQFHCPVCSSGSTAVALNNSGWGLNVERSFQPPSTPRSWSQAPPRYVWPSLNPRASPSLDIA